MDWTLRSAFGRRSSHIVYTFSSVWVRGPDLQGLHGGGFLGSVFLIFLIFLNFFKYFEVQVYTMLLGWRAKSIHYFAWAELKVYTMWFDRPKFPLESSF